MLLNTTLFEYNPGFARDFGTVHRGDLLIILENGFVARYRDPQATSPSPLVRISIGLTETGRYIRGAKGARGARGAI